MTPWFDEQTAGQIGGYLGMIIGLGVGGGVGGMTWYYVKKGWKKFTYALYILCILAGLIILGTGLAALITGQPYHVWYPFVLAGAMTACVIGGIFPVVRKRFTEREQQIMDVQDL